MRNIVGHFGIAVNGIWLVWLECFVCKTFRSSASANQQPSCCCTPLLLPFATEQCAIIGCVNPVPFCSLWSKHCSNCANRAALSSSNSLQIKIYQKCLSGNKIHLNSCASPQRPAMACLERSVHCRWRSISWCSQSRNLRHPEALAGIKFEEVAFTYGDWIMNEKGLLCVTLLQLELMPMPQHQRRQSLFSVQRLAVWSE